MEKRAIGQLVGTERWFAFRYVRHSFASKDYKNLGNARRYGKQDIQDYAHAVGMPTVMSHLQVKYFRVGEDGNAVAGPYWRTIEDLYPYRP